MEYFDKLFQDLELKQLFVLEQKIKKQIDKRITELELPAMEVAKLRHLAINEKTITNE